MGSKGGDARRKKKLPAGLPLIPATRPDALFSRKGEEGGGGKEGERL